MGRQRDAGRHAIGRCPRGHLPRSKKIGRPRGADAFVLPARPTTQEGDERANPTRPHQESHHGKHLPTSSMSRHGPGRTTTFHARHCWNARGESRPSWTSQARNRSSSRPRARSSPNPQPSGWWVRGARKPVGQPLSSRNYLKPDRRNHANCSSHLSLVLQLIY